MKDLSGFLGGLLQDPAAKGALGGLAGGVLGGLLVNKKARKRLGETAVAAGGAAALAGVAYYAYRKVQERRAGESGASAARQDGESFDLNSLARSLNLSPGESQAAPDAVEPSLVDSGFLPPQEDKGARDTLSLHLLQAMVAAANADGEIDGAELRAVLDAMETADLDASDKSAVLAALNKPLGADAVAGLAASPEEAMELYAASLAAVDGDNMAERAYLSMLGARLRLDPEVVAEMHRATGMPDPV